MLWFVSQVIAGKGVIHIIDQVRLCPSHARERRTRYCLTATHLIVYNPQVLSLDDNDSTPPKSDADDTTVDAAPPNLAQEEDEESALMAQTQGNLSALLSLMPELSVTAALMQGLPEDATLLAPTDAAWSELMYYSGLDTAQQLVALPNLRGLLQYHVLSSAVNLSAVEPGARVPTLEVGETHRRTPRTDMLERGFADSWGVWCVSVACAGLRGDGVLQPGRRRDVERRHRCDASRGSCLRAGPRAHCASAHRSAHRLTAAR